MIDFIPEDLLRPLAPQRHVMPDGRVINYFRNYALEVVKLDFTVEAGSAWQQMKCQAHAANHLFGEATAQHDAAEVAEFLDFRGIVVERMIDVCVGNVSFYFLRRYAEELFPLIREMFEEPAVTQQMFDATVASRRQQLSVGFQKTSYVARNKFYELLYGFDHPLGTYAEPIDLDLLTMESVTDYMRQHYRLGEAQVVMSGCVDDELLALADRYFAVGLQTAGDKGVVGDNHLVYCPQMLGAPNNCSLPRSERFPIENAVQSTIRVGRILPMGWESVDYARFMVLSTVLGGYFGSRLMSNIREEKGYTYGIYSMTQIHRGSILFYITADVAAEAEEAAMGEVMKEVRRLREEAISEEELDRVRNYMAGDFIRSIDGVFEVSERYRQMVSTGVDERLSSSLLDAISSVTPVQLQDLAQRYLCDLLSVVAGPEKEKVC